MPSSPGQGPRPWNQEPASQRPWRRQIEQCQLYTSQSCSSTRELWPQNSHENMCFDSCFSFRFRSSFSWTYPLSCLRGFREVTDAPFCSCVPVSSSRPSSSSSFFFLFVSAGKKTGEKNKNEKKNKKICFAWKINI